MKVYGIANCSTVKAARAWLDANAHPYEFVDYKKSPPTAELLVRWCKIFGWEKLLNRRGTTWRMLDAAIQNRVTDEKSAIVLMLDKPSSIKRPVVESGKVTLLGFDEAEFTRKLSS